MVDGQLRPNKVSDASILAVMEEQPRELFVPKALRGVAYNDDGIDLGAGRYLMEPVAAARLLQAVTGSSAVPQASASTTPANATVSPRPPDFGIGSISRRRCDARLPADRSRPPETPAEPVP